MLTASLDAPTSISSPISWSGLQVQPEAVPVLPEQLDQSRGVQGPATPTRTAPQLPQVTPIRISSPPQGPSQAAQIDALREQGFQDHTHTNVSMIFSHPSRMHACMLVLCP